jgi:hypothetical protein
MAPKRKAATAAEGSAPTRHQKAAPAEPEETTEVNVCTFKVKFTGLTQTLGQL